MARWRCTLVGAFALTAGACGAGTRPLESAETGPDRSRAAPTIQPVAADAERYLWVEETRSPQASALSVAFGDAALACASYDMALSSVAERIARRELAEHSPLDVGEINFALRSHGAPYVWPRTWSLVGERAANAAAEPLAAWLASFSDGGERRCGVALRGDAAGAQAVAVVAVDVLADLEPLPTRVRAGSWLDVRARLLVAASDANVLVLGPRGRPHRVSATLDGSRVRARFRADREGTWLLQVLANTESGPRPVAEAMLSAGAELPAYYASAAVPGEGAPRAGLDDASQVFEMVNAARREERLPELSRNRNLDRLAEEHARAMLAARRLAHDLGGGGPADRLRDAGLVVRSVGENVAHSASPKDAHRALWASPSHRENLLQPAHEVIGVGAAPDPDGSVWVCELFAKLP